MEVSPKTLREVEFREKMRGYHQEDVDQFLEKVAVAFEVLHDRLRQAVERAQRAEAAASEAAAASQDHTGNDETLRRTLVLAQRTADLAVSEAREQAARLLAGAEQQAQGMLADAEDRARRAHEESVAEMRADLARLEAKRQQAQGEVDLIRRWVDEQRSHLTASLRDALRAMERSATTSAPPTSRPIDLPPARSSEGRALDSPSRPSSSVGNAPEGSLADPHQQGSDTVAWPAPQPGGSGGYPGPAAAHAEPGHAEPRSSEPAARREAVPQPASSRPDPSRLERGRPRPQVNAGGDDEGKRVEAKPPAAVVRAETADHGARAPEPQGRERPAPQPGTGEDRSASSPEDQALDDFFDDERFAEERRFGGRLRRRR